MPIRPSTAPNRVPTDPVIVGVVHGALGKGRGVVDRAENRSYNVLAVRAVQHLVSERLVVLWVGLGGTWLGMSRRAGPTVHALWVRASGEAGCGRLLQPIQRNVQRTSFPKPRVLQIALSTCTRAGELGIPVPFSVKP
jgi:hypothetical protein